MDAITAPIAETAAACPTAKPTAKAVDTTATTTTDAFRMGTRQASRVLKSVAASGARSARLDTTISEMSTIGLITFATFWIVLPGARLPDSQDVNQVDVGGPEAEDRHRYDGRFTKAVPASGSNRTENPDRQVRESHLELEGAAGRPADGVGDLVREEEMSDEATDPTSGNADDEERDQQRL